MCDCLPDGVVVKGQLFEHRIIAALNTTETGFFVKDRKQLLPLMGCRCVLGVCADAKGATVSLRVVVPYC